MSVWKMTDEERREWARKLQLVNDNAICPQCGAVGRVNNICVPCERKNEERLCAAREEVP